MPEVNIGASTRALSDVSAHLSPTECGSNELFCVDRTLLQAQWPRPESYSISPLCSRTTSLTHLPLSRLDRPKYLIDKRPSDYEYAWMSDHVYEGSSLNIDDSLPEFENWKIHSTDQGPSGHFSVIYVNKETEQIVVAYRGIQDCQALLKDVRKIVLNRLDTLQKAIVFNSVKYAVALLKEKNQKGGSYHLSFTGHSFGAFLAELSVFYAHADFQLMDVNAVTFGSPGSRDVLEMMQPKHKRIDLDELDMISYVFCPTPMNTVGEHPGTLCQISFHQGERERALIDFPSEMDSIQSDTMIGFLKVFKEIYPDVPASLYMTDWPVFGKQDSDLDYLERYLERKKNQPFKNDPNFNLSYKCLYRYDPDFDHLTMLPLRHFLPEMRVFLKDFYREKRKSTTERIVAVCKKLHVPEELTEHLVSYKKEGHFIVLKEGNIREFRLNLSRYLADHCDQVAELLHLRVDAVKRLTSLWNVPSKNKMFIDRTCLHAIEAALNDADIVICHGLGGMGKTQLALEFAWRNHQKYHGTAWFNAENVKTLLIEYDRLGQDLNLHRTENMDMRERGLQVKRWLEDPLHAGWLLIYDNVQTYGGPEGISAWIPSTGGHALITSRLSEASYASIPVVKFPRCLSIEFLEKILGKPFLEEDKRSIDTLAGILGDFPLGLAQAGAYIKELQIKVSTYLERYKTAKKRLLQDQTHAKSTSVLQTDYERAVVYITWDMTLEAIGRESPLAARWLKVCSYLANDIPDYLFKAFAQKGSNNPDEQDYERARGILSQYSMLTIDKETKNGSMHPLLREVIQMKEGEQETNTIVNAAELLHGCFPKGSQVEDYAIMRQLLPHYEIVLSALQGGTDQSLLLVHLLQQANMYRFLGHPHKQKERLEQALTIFEKDEGADPFEIGKAMANLGGAHGFLGDPYKQKELLERALTIFEKTDSADPLEVARTIINLGNTYKALGDPHQQKKLLERAVLILKEECGEGHFKMARAWVILGNAYGALGDPHQQKELTERALTIFENHFGKEHFYLASTLEELGNAYGALGDPHQQKKLLERALTILQNHYGKDHFETAKRLATLGSVYGSLGDPYKQKEFNQQALTILESQYGRNHFETAKILANLGLAYGILGDPCTQKKLAERALTILENHYGKGHFETAKILANLGLAHGVLGDLYKQKERLEQALVILENHYGKDHFQTAHILANLGSVYGILGDPYKQKELAERALTILENHYDKGHFETAKTLGNLASAYRALGNLDQQKELLEQALTISENHYGKDHFETAEILVNLGIAYGCLGDLYRQKELIQQALTILENHYGNDHFYVSKTVANLGKTYGALGDPYKQRELIQRALTILENYYGNDHFYIAETLEDLGSAYGALRDLHQQKKLLERALTILENHYGKDHFYLARTLIKLGDTCAALKKPHQQRELLERALLIQEKHYGDNHSELAITLIKLGDSYAALKEPDEQERLFKRGLAIGFHTCDPDIDAQWHSAQTPLHVATRQGNLNLVQYFVKHGTDINTRDQSGQTPIHVAASQGNLSLVQYLVRNGAKVPVKDRSRQTPLHLAATEGNLEVVQYLVKNGAKVHVKDQSGQTAIHVAATKGNLEVVQYLVKNGAKINRKNLAKKCNNEAVITFLLEEQAHPSPLCRMM